MPLKNSIFFLVTYRYNRGTMKKYLLLVVFFLTVFLPAFSHATSVRSINLKELVNASEYVFKGTILSKDTTHENGLFATYYTAAVLDCIKCPTIPENNRIVWKQIAEGEYTLNGERIRQNFRFPTYQVGNTSLFFLSEPHPKTGLTAPVGLYQGVFEVKTENGQETIPQLKKRLPQLQKGLSKQDKFLRFQLNAATDDQSYDHFRSMIETAKD